MVAIRVSTDPPIDSSKEYEEETTYKSSDVQILYNTDNNESDPELSLPEEVQLIIDAAKKAHFKYDIEHSLGYHTSVMDSKYNRQFEEGSICYEFLLSRDAKISDEEEYKTLKEQLAKETGVPVEKFKKVKENIIIEVETNEDKKQEVALKIIASVVTESGKEFFCYGNYKGLGGTHRNLQLNIDRKFLNKEYYLDGIEREVESEQHMWDMEVIRAVKHFRDIRYQTPKEIVSRPLPKQIGYWLNSEALATVEEAFKELPRF
jgi:hypothetical protein